MLPVHLQLTDCFYLKSNALSSSGIRKPLPVADGCFIITAHMSTLKIHRVTWVSVRQGGICVYVNVLLAGEFKTIIFSA